MNSRFEVARTDLRHTRFTRDPDAARPLAEGEARLRIDRFALTANNITYAAFGESMKYWQFFPTGNAAWGCIPVWGFAVVEESRAQAVLPGERLYGYLPMGTHLVVQPARVSAPGFVDAAPHRQDLPAIYNHLQFCRSDPGYSAALEGQQAVLRPLFTTSFLIDDFLADERFFGAQQVLLSSASSKTAYGTAHCLSQRRGTPGAPRIVGLTSPGNLAFTRSLGCYDELLAYADLTTLGLGVPTVYVDFAGDAALRRRVHEHFDGTLVYSCAVGGTHWAGLGSGAGLPGPHPTLFFAPSQARKRSAAPPEGWGAAGLQARLGAAWRSFMQPVTHAAEPWLVIAQTQGEDAVRSAYAALLDGGVDPRLGTMLSLHPQAAATPRR